MKIKKSFVATDSVTHFSFLLPSVELWSHDNPKPYKVVVSTASDKIEDQVRLPDN